MIDLKAEVTVTMTNEQFSTLQRLFHCHVHGRDDLHELFCSHDLASPDPEPLRVQTVTAIDLVALLQGRKTFVGCLVLEEPTS